LGGGGSCTVIGKNGESRLVQVCKSALTITEGLENLKLARKAPPPSAGGKPTKQIYMHRYYSSCCNVPLINTYDSLGFVGILSEFLDEEQEKFDKVVRVFPEEALGEPENREPDLFFPAFLWKLFRYQFRRRPGPAFDYEQEPVYWSVGGGGGSVEAKTEK